MKKFTIFFLIVIICQVIKGSFVITYPPELVAKFTKSSLSVTVADFGEITKNFVTRGRIYYDPQSENDNQYGCKPIINMTIEQNITPIDVYPMIMVNRGSCSFVSKTRHVQQLGGHIALIVNNQPGNVNRIIMADDGTGSDILIPTILITKEDGNIIKQFFKDNQDNQTLLSKVIMEIDFYEVAADQISLEVFISAADDIIYQFAKDFFPYIQALDKQVNFVPYYVTHVADDSVLSSNCICKGMYCSPSKNFISGKDIVKESLYQKCLYTIVNDEKSYNPNVYWQYMINFYSMCLNKANPSVNNECRKQVLKAIDYLNEDKIINCIKESFSVTELSDATYENSNLNKLLDEDYTMKVLHEIKSTPHVYVNKNSVDEQLTGEIILGVICSAFPKRPDVCSEYFRLKKLIGSKKGFNWIMILFVLLFIIIINLIIYIICKKYLNKRMSERIETDEFEFNGRVVNVISNYFKLQEVK